MNAKAGVKRLARPVMVRFYDRIDARLAPLTHDLAAIDARVAPLAGEVDRRVAPLVTEIESLTRYIPIVMNTIASQNAASRDRERRLRSAEQLVSELSASLEKMNEGLQYLEQRGEFIRRELLYEQRYGGQAKELDTPQEPAVLDTEKLGAMADGIRLNVGAGHIPMEGYLNVDSREMPGIDITADIRRLPFGVGEVSEIYSAHLLEHFPVEELRRTILPYWVSLLKDGGRLVAVVPDTETMVAETAAGNIAFEDFVEVTYGGQEYAGDFHFNGFSQRSLVSLLEEAGLSDVGIREAARRNGLCYEMEVEAIRRADRPA